MKSVGRSDAPPGRGGSFIRSDYPSLEMSSDSSDDEALATTAAAAPPAAAAADMARYRKSRSLMDASSERRLLSQEMAKNVLSTVSRIHFQDNHRRSTETQSSISSPGRTNTVTLREKMSRLSRDQRKDLLIRTDLPLITENSLLSGENSNSALLQMGHHHHHHPQKPASPEHRRGRGFQSLMEESIVRWKRQAQFRNRSRAKQVNRIALHIYDLIAKDTLMQLPWGCMCEIGKCFNEMNSALHELGTGAYHVGIEINGVEYAYGATSTPGRSGVFSCIPKLSPGYQYRTTIDFGERPLMCKKWVTVRSTNPESPGPVYKEVEEFVDGRKIIKEMVPEYMGIDYDILRKNCCTFARDACMRLGIKEEEIPSWFGNLAQSGAMTQDVAYSVTQPLLSVLSSCEEKIEEPIDDVDGGFEVVASRNESNTKDIVLVIPVHKMKQWREVPTPSMRRTVTWTY